MFKRGQKWKEGLKEGVGQRNIYKSKCADLREGGDLSLSLSHTPHTHKRTHAHTAHTTHTHTRTRTHVLSYIFVCISAFHWCSLRGLSNRSRLIQLSNLIECYRISTTLIETYRIMIKADREKQVKHQQCLL